MFQRRLGVGNEWAIDWAGLENWGTGSGMEIFKSDDCCVELWITFRRGVQVRVAMILVGQKD